MQGQQVKDNDLTCLKHIPILLCYAYKWAHANENVEDHIAGVECIQVFVELMLLLQQQVRAVNDKSQDQKFNIIVLAHNGHRYDDIFVLPMLQHLSREPVQVGGSAGNIKFMRTGILEFRDTFELMPMSLKQLAIDMQTEHRKIEPKLTFVSKKVKGWYKKKI
jgi:hypothetical protein